MHGSSHNYFNNNSRNAGASFNAGRCDSYGSCCNCSNGSCQRMRAGAGGAGSSYCSGGNCCPGGRCLRGQSSSWNQQQNWHGNGRQY